MKLPTSIATFLENLKGPASIALSPIRALILAYSYVLSGKKVEKPYEWRDI